jgi:uncharacterized protein YeaO (DUF488 family)
VPGFAADYTGLSDDNGGEVAMKVAIKRVYEEAKESDGTRILVDRLWPRGLAKEKAKVDLWIKEVAPSNELRKWFAHDPKKWPEFQARYKEELRVHPEPLALLKKEAAKGPITLLYGAHDEEHNQAVALEKMLRGK